MVKSEAAWLRRVLPFSARVLVLICWTLCGVVYAGPANDTPFTLTQPDGASFKARLIGDERDHWVENAYGYAIARGTDGAWRYLDSSETARDSSDGTEQDAADQIHGVLTEIPAQDPPPRWVRTYDPASRVRSDSPVREDGAPVYAAPQGQFTGNILFILVEFDDQSGFHAPDLWGKSAPNTLSLIFRYFEKASYGRVTLRAARENSGARNDGVIGWLNVSQRLKELEIAQKVTDQSGNHPNTSDMKPGTENMMNALLAKAAILEANQHINFAPYDTNGDGIVSADELAIQIVVAGYEGSDKPVPEGGKSVWACSGGIPSRTIGLPQVDGKKVARYSMVGEIHSGDGDHQATYGIMVHEFGHQIFEWPDLYNTRTKKPGIGPWCVMASGNWGKTAAQKYAGETPVLPCAALKYFRDWVIPQQAPGADAVLSFTAAGAVSANGANTAALGGSSGDEFFLIENRENIGYDKGLQGRLDKSDWKGGLAIWHVDLSMSSNEDDNHRLVSLEGANGADGVYRSYFSPNVLFRKGAYDEFLWFGTPNSELYTGKASGLIVEEISRSGGTMTARMEKAGVLRVMIEPQGARDAGAMWMVCRGAFCSLWSAPDTWVLWFPGKQADVRFKPVSGWTAPPEQNVDIQPLAETKITGTYAEQTLQEITFGGEFSNEWPYGADGTCKMTIAGDITAPKAEKVYDGFRGAGYYSWEVSWKMNLSQYKDESDGRTAKHNLKISHSGQVGDEFVDEYIDSGGTVYTTTYTIIEKTYKILVRDYALDGLYRCRQTGNPDQEIYASDGKFTLDTTVDTVLDGLTWKYCVSDQIMRGWMTFKYHIKVEIDGVVSDERDATADYSIVEFVNLTYAW